MKIFGITALVWLMIGSALQAQVEETQDHRFIIYTHEGETYMDGSIEGIDITATRPSRRELRKGRKRLAKFTKLLWNVHRTYPYAVKVGGVIAEVEQELEGITDPKERRKFIKSRETSLFGEYEDDLRKMSRSQGRVMVKLVYRETGKATFYLIKDMKSGASAVFWQSIGLLFGINLKSDYDPEEDAMIEEIVEDLENGGYNIAYKKYDYRLL